MASTLRDQGAQIDAAAARPATAPGGRRPGPLREGTSALEPLGLVLVVTPSCSLAVAGLEEALEGMADLRIGGKAVSGSPSCVVLCADGTEGNLVGVMGRVRGLYPGVPLLVFGPRLDLPLALAALKHGADGFAHAMMERGQVVRALKVVQGGGLAAPRRLLPYLLGRKEKPKVENLSARQREVVGMAAEGESNAAIAGRLGLSVSTVKQHLRAAYRALGVRNRVEAARMMKHHPRNA